MAEMPHQNTDIYEDDFYVVTDDPDEEMVNVAFVERGLVMRFDYEEFLELVPVLERTRDYLQRRARPSSANGR
jgi:hypothetical protein